MADTNKLRPEVREAVEVMDARVSHATWQPIRAELLRQADETDRLHKVACKQLRRAQKAEAELAALKATMKPCARVRNGEVNVYMDTAHKGKKVAVVVVEE